MGDHNEHVHKRLRTVDMDSHMEQEPTPAQPHSQAEDAAAFEHIKQGSDAYDAQTYGRCIEGFFAHWALSELVLYDCVPLHLLQIRL